MYRFVNIPHKDCITAKLESRVEHNHAKVVVVDASGQKCGVTDLFIGEHLFEPGRHDDLRKMVADAIRQSIEAGRERGYAHALADIRRALGVKDR